MTVIQRLKFQEIQNTNLINADDLNSEFDQLVNELNAKETAIAAITTNSGTLAGVKTFTSEIVSSLSANPSSPVDGSFWYNTSTDKAYAVMDGDTYELNALYQNFLKVAAPTYASASTFTIASGAAVASAGGTMAHSTSKTVNIATSGANGLDTGSEASGTWYYLYMIGKTDGTTDYVLSVTNESVTGSITLPSGYTLKRQMPFAVRNDGSSNFLPWQKMQAMGSPVFYLGDFGDPNQSGEPYRMLTAGAATSFTDVALGSVVPPISQLVWAVFGFVNSGATTTQRMFVRTKGRSGDNGGVIMTGYTGSAGTAAERTQIFETDSSQTLQYMMNAGNGSIQILGWIPTNVI